MDNETTDTRARASGNRRHRWTAKAIHEAKRFLAMFVYLWILFGLFLIHESIILAQHGISFTRYGFAFINAWILAKVMLVAEDLNIARGFESRPLIYPVLYKSTVFGIVFLCFSVAEQAALGLWHGQRLTDSIPAVGNGSPLGILSLALLIVFALVPYFAFREIDRAIGSGKLRALLLSRRLPSDAAESLGSPAHGARR